MVHAVRAIAFGQPLLDRNRRQRVGAPIVRYAQRTFKLHRKMWSHTNGVVINLDVQHSSPNFPRVKGWLPLYKPAH